MTSGLGKKQNSIAKIYQNMRACDKNELSSVVNTYKFIIEEHNQNYNISNYFKSLDNYYYMLIFS